MSRLLFIFVLAMSYSLARAGEREAIVGVWRYAGEVDTRADGGPAPLSALSETDGMLIYTADGFMSVVHMPKNRSWSSETASIADLRQTVTNGTAYAGRYEVDPTTNTITHITSVSMEPDFQGRRLTRSFALTGDILKLMGTFPYKGEDIHFTITWTRVNKSKK